MRPANPISVRTLRRWPLRRLMALLSLALMASCSGRANDGDISASGTIEATEVNVAARASGEIRQLRFEEGSAVRQGDTLAVIDHETLDLQLRQAEAGVALSDAQFRLLLNGARIEDIRQAEEGLKQAEASLQNAQEDARRTRALFESGSATQKQVEDAEARHAVALAQVNAAKQGLKKVQHWTRPEDLQAAQARLDQAGAAADLLRKAIADGYVIAPLTGVVTQRPVETGELVGPGGILATLSRLDRVHLMIYVTAVELGRVKLGQQAEVRIDADPNRTFPGRVVYISPEAEFTPKNVQTKEDRVKLVFGVKIEIDNPDATLKPGLPADATIRIRD